MFQALEVSAQYDYILLWETDPLIRSSVQYLHYNKRLLLLGHTVYTFLPFSIFQSFHDLFSLHHLYQTERLFFLYNLSEKEEHL